ncbi:MAG: EAL domain-containing protein [Eubacterium sp.]|nr:EAL domain-containing protein [Eubacterium sp.]
MEGVGIQLCGLAILLVIIVLGYRQQNLGLRSNKAFLMALISATITLFVDVASIAALYHIDSLPYPLTYALCKAYIVCVAWVAYCGFNYMVMGIHIAAKRVLYHKVSFTFVSIMITLIAVLPMSVDADPAHLYSYGPAVIATYVCGMLFLIATIGFCFAYRHKMSVHHFKCVMVWMSIWFLAAVVQFINNALPMTGFAMALGLMIIFTQLENPEAIRDSDTGIFNMHALMVYVEHLYEEKIPFSVITINITPLETNLTLGETKFLMVNLTRRLSKIKDATLFRNVGDGFVLVFKDRMKMYETYGKLRSILASNISLGERPLPIDVTYLIFPDSSVTDNYNDFFRYNNYYASVHNDEDYFTIDSEAVGRLVRNEHMKILIDDAMAEGRVEVYYQPIYSFEDGKFTSAEALVRIRERDGSIVPPALFIPVAESTGQILPLGEEIVKQVGNFMSTSDIRELGIEYMEINLSARQCSDKNLAESLSRVLAREDVDPSTIIFEITESASLESKGVLMDNVSELAESGARFALDDFGTGQSNLNYIMSMPVDIIKFDRTLTQDYFVDEKSQFIMDCVIDMVKRMDMKIVAEGVESAKQLERMKEIGIDYIQGYYFSKPLPKEDFRAFIRENNKNK